MTKLDPIEEFRQDHRKVRDGVLSIIDALKAHDLPKAREILGGLNTLAGPHFRYEEEALYPALRTFLGEYVDQLLEEHGGVIGTARTCAQLLGKDSLTDEEADAAAGAARKILVHVSNCDGLAILSERLTPRELDALGEKFLAARTSGVPMLEWADTIRKKGGRLWPD